MATFFGEVLSVYSRAVEEDEFDLTRESEEDEQIRREIEEKRSVDVRWFSQTDGSLPCSDLIIAAGPNATGFISAYVLSSGRWPAVGCVSLWNERSDSTPGAPSCVLYRQQQVLICQCCCYVAEDQLFQWTEKVLGCVQERGLRVTVLSDCAAAEYKTADYLSRSSSPFLRCLQTRSHTHPVACPALEQPNISCGLAAAVLSHCQVRRIAAVVYQCYSDVLQPDSLSMQAYLPAVTAVLKLDQSPGAEVLQKLTRVSAVQSNLYT